MKLEFAQAELNARVAPFAAVLEQEEFRNELDRLFRSQWLWGAPLEMRARVLKRHTIRCTFEIAVRTERAWHSLIAKAYATDRSDVFQAMEALRQAGFGPDAEFSIPQPFVYLSSLGVRLEESVQGPSAKEIFLNGGPDEHIAAAERCGQWLGRFHMAAPRLGKVANLSKEFPRYRDWTDQVTRFGEPLARKAELLFQKLESAAPALGTIESCAGHGSYIPEHVILSSRRAATIDLDEYDVGDAGRDVAWFIVSLRRLALKHLGSHDALDRAAEKFLRTYVSSGRKDALVNFSFYKALECLHGAKRDVAGQTPPALDRAEIMLDEGLRAWESHVGERTGQRCRRDVELPGGEGGARQGDGHHHAAAGRFMKPMTWIMGGVLLLASLGTGGYVYLNGDQKPLVQYKTTQIGRGTVTQAVTATGTINPVITVQVGSQVSGIIKALYADFNSVVKAGQVVAQVDPAPFQAAVTQMNANLQNALGNLARSRADLALKKLNFDRTKVLFEQQLNAQQDVDNARAAYESSQANLQMAEAQVKHARAQVDTAKVNLEYTTIHSPVNGIVISRNVDIGQTVAASFQAPVLFTIAKDLTKMQVHTNVSESDIGGITEGKPATFVVDAYPNQVFKGTITQVRNAPITLQNVVTYNVVIGADNPDLRLRPGMTANASIIIARHENVLRIPNQALRFKPSFAKGGPSKSGGSAGVEGKAKPTVWLPNPQGDPTAAEVKTEITDGTYTELVEGPLREGTEIIVGLDMSRGSHGSSVGSLPPGFGPQPSKNPKNRMPKGL